MAEKRFQNHIQKRVYLFSNSRNARYALLTLLVSGFSAIVGFGLLVFGTQIGLFTPQQVQRGIFGFRNLAARELAQNVSPAGTQAVLGASIINPDFIFKVNVPAFFTKGTTFSQDVSVDGGLTVQGKAVFSRGINLDNANLDLGTGKLTASNIVYSLTAGPGLTVSTGQTPTIANTGVLSLQNKTGNLLLTGGSGISIDGLTITNSDSGSSQDIFKTIAVSGQNNITAGSNSDTLTFVAGSGVTLTTDSTNKKLTIASSTGSSQWTSSGLDIYYTGGNVGIGTTSPSSALEVIGGLTVSGTTTLNSVSYNWPSTSGTNGYVLSTNGSGTLSWLNPTSFSGNMYWDLANGALSPVNSTNDVLLGGTATASALVKFGGTAGASSFFDTGGNVGIGTNNPDTLLYVKGSGSTGVNAATFDVTVGGVNSKIVAGANASRASFGTLTNTDLGLGTDNTYTQLYLQAGGNVGIGTSMPNNILSIASKGQYSGLELDRSSNSVTMGLGGSASLGSSGYPFSLVNGSGTGDINLNNSFLLQGNSGNVGIGTTSPIGLLDLEGAPVGKALIILNETGSNDILTASKSGATVFTLNSNGDLMPGTTDTSNIGSASDEWNNVYAKNLNVSGNITSTGTISGFWQRTAGTIAPLNTTDDLIVGGSATSSALVQFSGTSATTGTGAKMTFNSLTSGNGLAVSSNYSGVTSGNLVNISASGTLATQGQTISGNLLNLSRNLTSQTIDNAITFDNASHMHGSGCSLSLSYTTGSGVDRFMVVTLTGFTSTGWATGVTYDGVSLTEAGSGVGIGFNNYISVWTLVNPPSGTYNLVASLGSGSCNDQTAMGVSTWANVDQTTPYSTVTTNSGSSSSPSVSITSSTNQVIIDNIGTNIGTTPGFTPGTGQTLRWNDQGYVGYEGGASSSKSSSGSSTTMSWNLTLSTAWGLVALAVNPVQSGMPIAISGDLAALSSNCVITGGYACADSAHILSLSQEYSSSLGTVLNVEGAGTGDLADFSTTNATANGLSVTLQSSSISQYALKLTGNNNGTNILYAGANGNVGIGTTSPAGLFDINGLFTVLSGGNVGIGNTNPSLATLDIDHSANDLLRLMSTSGGAGNHAYMDFTTYNGTGVSARIGAIDMGAWNGGLVFEVNNNSTSNSTTTTEAMRISNAGNVGIGTTGPGAKLDISAGNTQDVLNLNGTNAPEMTFQNNGATKFELGIPTGANNYINGSAVNDTIFRTQGGKMLFSTSSSGATNDLTLSGGNVGIGTPAPGFGLDVTGSQASTASAMITNSNTGTGADVLALKVGATSVGTANRFLTFLDGNGEVVGNVQGNGAGGVTYATTGIDFAEYYHKANITENIPTGTVVCMTASGIDACGGEAGAVLGVVSSHPGFVGGSSHTGDPSYTLVGLVGQLPVRVASTSGVIATGDPLAPGPDGTVIKATTMGEIVGHALEAYNSQTDKKMMIMASVSVSWFNPSGTNYVSLLQDKTLIAGITSGISLGASASAFPESTFANLTVNTATVSGNLMVMGRTTVSDLGVTGDITSGVMAIHGLAGTIGTIGTPLKLQPLATDGIDMFSGVVTFAINGDIKTEGAVTAKTVQANKFNITGTENVLSASAGTVTISAGKTSVAVRTSVLDAKSLIFVTPDSPVAIGSKKIGNGAFEIDLASPAHNDIHVNWWVVN